MAFKVTMNGVASYSTPAILQSDKKVTLVYGLNGTGKSTLSNYLYDPADNKFHACSNEGFSDAHVYVYNNKFVRDNFYEIDKLSGIFTLSKVNKEIEQEIETKTKALSELDTEQKTLDAAISKKDAELLEKRSTAEEETWKIKTKYSGGDRVLEYCLKGLMKAKGGLFDHVAALPAPSEPPTKTIEVLRKEVEALQGDQAKSYPKLPKLMVVGVDAESDTILGQPIIGNQDSPVANLIKKLGSADWVSEGIPFIDTLQSEGDETCPFCQAKTISSAVAATIKNYFDATFESSMTSLKGLLARYRTFVESQAIFDNHQENPFYIERKLEIDALHGQLKAIWKANVEAIERKIKAPSLPVTLTLSKDVIAALNLVIDAVNKSIEVHNAKIESKDTALADIKDEFWKICRWEYNSAIETYNNHAEARKKERTEEQTKKTKFQSDKTKMRTDLAELQRKTVNIDEAVDTINSRLVDLGIDSFKIIKSGENRYKVSRNGVVGEDFLSLSEGEKTVISFLYFVELCKGKKSPTQIGDKKIVVIDDPISSLSHIYIFNIGELIKAEFSNSDKFEHVIILTHSLYFFYELTEIKEERRHERQKLMRITKNSLGSKIVDMKYEEVQNDYQAYWNVIMDEGQHPALIANCMRNVIEYFFSFVRKMPLANVYQQPKLKEAKHQAFYRFMNRESHSVGQNLFDHKEFDYAKFKEAFKIVFDETGFPEHYKAMSKGK
ncbi:AAA family ATPase [Rugamonas apoptosis]|uniref:AAA family ATPase n=1 Tax=Rugamonas apoptosis TaxID=2758570 RepID=A0A7W2ILP6_9BURK|nr:AAA family ATPase [Rugamonas apoptosis]MBA5688697.1 AAA family ATPase [Rugamonas apoptosis]